MPGESININTTLPDQTVLIEGWNSSHWPEPQATEVNNGKLQITNTSSRPVILRDNKVNSIKITSTNHLEWTPLNLSTIATKQTKSTHSLSDSETLDLINIGEITAEIRDLLSGITLPN